MIFGKEAYLGSFNLKSVVITQGMEILIVSRPPSTSLVTLIVLSSFTSTFDANVA